MVVENRLTMTECEVFVAAEDWIEGRDFLFAFGDED
jgi:hypothetical protein